MNQEDSLARSIEGCLLGIAVGDALGLPFEGISARRQAKMARELNRHRLVFGRGMVSDDTEHAAMTAQSLIAAAGDSQAFVRRLSWKLRWWLVGIPAGIGLATLRAILKLWLGFGPQRSGVFSAGNGPAMRAPVIGAAYGRDPQRMCDLVKQSTTLTHTDPKAVAGAIAVAIATHVAATSNPDNNLAVQYVDRLSKTLDAANLPREEIDTICQRVLESVDAGSDTIAFAQSLGLTRGVTGYIYHTLPIALHAWLTHSQDFRGAIESAIRCGGDTDTVAAIVGGIVGSGVGPEGIPTEWISGIVEYPRSMGWLRKVAARLAEVAESGHPGAQIPLNPIAVLVRNAVFLAIVLTHGFRRALPPY